LSCGTFRSITTKGTPVPEGTASGRPGIAHAWNNRLPPVVLALDVGCCPDPEGTGDHSSGVRRYLIRGRQFKTARDDDGNHLSAGVIRETPVRRTLAWHIARRPGGLVALAVQYGHLRTLVSQGYSSRQRDGIHQLLDLETARAVAEHLSEVHDALHHGEGVSGPAAQPAAPPRPGRRPPRRHWRCTPERTPLGPEGPPRGRRPRAWRASSTASGIWR